MFVQGLFLMKNYTLRMSIEQKEKIKQNKIGEMRLLAKRLRAQRKNTIIQQSRVFLST